MTRLINKRMRDSFNIGDIEKIRIHKGIELINGARGAGRVSKAFSAAEKQRILTLKRVVK